VFRQHEIEAVIHFAAFALVGESMEHPAMYYRNNVITTLELLEAMREAAYGVLCSRVRPPPMANQKSPITEDTVQLPINPYGFSKLVIEKAMTDYARAYGFGCAALRYFNASGASPLGGIGEDHTPETHLIPIVLQVALGQRPIGIYGTDYPTDGTCIRDYIHVDDLGSRPFGSPPEARTWNQYSAKSTAVGPQRFRSN
jgi:UDP-glucose 4-epimerase